eukprot:TRINITY_DN367_c0_g2_i1.p1 TRINITY_DN367_c0_g2~~TRINITY_DN367_c0_g2_i1.p1  ORF type:complete len:465 (-),score=138.71 TRINITY_DN367_c0_g2_i1:70-1464(-)
MRFVFSLLLIFFLDFSRSTSLLGVSPEAIHRYQTETFTCFDGSKTIPKDQLNDNYCDCRDGSDEPGTPACPNAQFWCINKGYVGRFIPTAWVSDGICDCCDGSDESSDHTPCENTCLTLGAETIKNLQNELAGAISGFEKRRSAIQSYEQEVQNRKLRLQEIEEELSVLTVKVDQLQQTKDKVHEEYQGVRNRIEQQIKSEFEEKRKSEKPEEPAESTKPEEPAESTKFEESNKDPENLEFVEDVKEISEESPISEQPYDEQTDEISERTEEYSESHETVLSSDPISSEENDALSKIDEHPDLHSIKEEKEQLEKEYNDKKSRKEQLERDRSDIEKFMKIDFGPSGVFFNLHEKTLEFKTKSGEYTYVVKPFEKVEQRGGSHVLLGNWDKWENDYTVMVYSNGQRCWGGPDRSIRVEIFCGQEDQILDVQEPNKCEYSMQLRTPVACSQEKVEQLRQQINAFGL